MRRGPGSGQASVLSHLYALSLVYEGAVVGSGLARPDLQGP